MLITSLDETTITKRKERVDTHQYSFSHCFLYPCLGFAQPALTSVGGQMFSFSSSVFLELCKRPGSSRVLEILKVTHSENTSELHIACENVVCCCCIASVMYYSSPPCGLQPARLLCPWAFLGKNTRVGRHAFLQEIFLTQELSPSLLHCRQILYY